MTPGPRVTARPSRPQLDMTGPAQVDRLKRAARDLGVTPNTLRSWLANGWLAGLDQASVADLRARLERPLGPPPGTGGDMRVVERYVEGKGGEPGLCEDLIYADEHFVAVLDGATDKTGRDYHGKTGGRFAVEVLAAALAELAPDATLDQAVDKLTARLDTAIRAACDDDAPDDRPCAVAAIFSRHRREVWRVGDVGVRVDDRAIAADKRIDTVTAQARAAMTAALLLNGADPIDVIAGDPGRRFVLPLLRLQHVFCNHPTSQWAYAAFNGTPVPASLRERFCVPAGSEVVLASDGYPAPARTLAEAERELADSLARDPLRIERDYATKGVAAGARSFDDRAYVRVLT